jgi:hypothetical protein
MAILHEATLTPRKDELVGPWLRTRPWWDGVDERGPVGTFRLDDPAGEVGIECFLFGSAGGSTLFVPVTYRGAPLLGADDHLVGVMEHSVLGTRHVYDACGDPVFVATVLDAIRSGGREAELHVRRADGTEVVREAVATARGTGEAGTPAHDPGAPVSVTEADDRTTVRGDGCELTILRRPTAAADGPGGPALLGSFEGGTDLVLAVVDRP